MCNVGYSQIILSSNELANSIAISFEWKQSRVSVEEKFTFAPPPTPASALPKLTDV